MEDQTEGGKPKLSRRQLLIRMAGLTATAVAAKYGLSWLMTPRETNLDPTIIEKEKNDDLGLGELHKNREEFFTLWPGARIWVVVNNALAAAKLDGKTLKKGEEYSLIDLLALAGTKNNLDPRKGYISGISLSEEFPFASVVDSQGLCLTANCLARTLALSPVRILEWHTHDEINEVTKNYFLADNQIVTHPLFSCRGTDAAVFVSPEGEKGDLRFIPQKDLRLRYKIMDQNSRQITPADFDELPEMAKIAAGYPASQTRKLRVPLLVRCAIGWEGERNWQVVLKPARKEEGGKVFPGFSRELVKDGKSVSQEEVFASYHQ